MDISPLVPKERKIIKAYGNGGFRVGEDFIQGAIMITPEGVAPWQVDGNTLTEKDFASFFALPNKPKLVLVGTGKTMQLLPPALRAPFKLHGISVDAMDTGAACRTYNVLLGEGRDVAALLLAI